MKDVQEDTPPSSINGDEISPIVEDGNIDFDEMEEIEFDDQYEDMDNDEEMVEIDDQSVYIFGLHKGSVFCCNMHPDGKFAVTGGEDDLAYVWSVETGAVVLKCEGHKDSVVFAEFSYDGAYLATGDMSGLIKVWKTNLENQNPWPIVFEYETGDLSLGVWHFGARVLILGTVAGDIYIFKIPSGETKILQGHNIKNECVKMFPDGKRLAAGYEDGTVKIWDLKTCQAIHTVPPNVHQIRVTDLDTHPENNLLASISTDGKVVIIASTSGKIVNQLETDKDLEMVSFCRDPQLDYFALGTLTGSITIWDCPRQMVRQTCSKAADNDASGVTKMFWIKNHLVTAGLNGTVSVYEGRSGEKTAVISGHTAEILDMCYNAKSNILLTASDDGTAKIFKYETNNIHVQT